MPKAMYIDTKRCIGCNACSIACKQENKAYGTWNFVVGSEKGEYPKPEVAVLPVLCMMCWDAPCKQKCDSLGYKAIVKRADGIVYIDQDRCVGCRQCETVCRFGDKKKAMTAGYRGILNFNPTTKKEEKCHFCMHRIDQGLLPACVVTCLAATREFGELSNLLAKYPNAKPMDDDDHSLRVSVLYSKLGGKSSYLTASYEGCIVCHGK